MTDSKSGQGSAPSRVSSSPGSRRSIHQAYPHAAWTLPQAQCLLTTILLFECSVEHVRVRACGKAVTGRRRGEGCCWLPPCACGGSDCRCHQQGVPPRQGCCAECPVATLAAANARLPGCAAPTLRRESGTRPPSGRAAALRQAVGRSLTKHDDVLYAALDADAYMVRHTPRYSQPWCPSPTIDAVSCGGAIFL